MYVKIYTTQFEIFTYLDEFSVRVAVARFGGGYGLLCTCMRKYTRRRLWYGDGDDLMSFECALLQPDFEWRRLARGACMWTKKSRHTYEGVMLHIGISHIIHMKTSRYAYEETRHTHMKESCRIYEPSHVTYIRSHATRTNESTSHVWHMKRSWQNT